MAQDLDVELEALKQKQADMKAELDAERKRLLEIQRKKKRILENQIRRAAYRLTTKERKRRTRRLILLGWIIGRRRGSTTYELRRCPVARLRRCCT